MTDDPLSHVQIPPTTACRLTEDSDFAKICQGTEFRLHNTAHLGSDLLLCHPLESPATFHIFEGDRYELPTSSAAGGTFQLFGVKPVTEPASTVKVAIYRLSRLLSPRIS